MVMLAELVDGVIGVDTHANTHTAAVCTPAGGVLTTTVAATTREGLNELLAFGLAAVPGRRVWAVEGCGSFGAGLTARLLSAGEQVVEVARPARARGRGQDKNDTVDAVRAARDALASHRPALPKQAPAVKMLQQLLAVRGSAVKARTEALNLLHALVLTAPEPIREPLRGLTGRALLEAAWMLPLTVPADDALGQGTLRLLVATVERVLFLSGQIEEHDREVQELTAAVVPGLRSRVGIGPVSAAQLAVGYGHHGRVPSEAAFAHLAGAAPIEASSGKTTRYRLNRGGDRQLNMALHTIAVTRMRHDPATRAYVERRRAEGKTDKEIRRNLKRYIARQTYHDLQHAQLAG